MIDSILHRLDSMPDALRAIVYGAAAEEVRFRPPSGAWSIVEIVSHLADEEVEDFRTRFVMTVETPDVDWPAIDPESAAKSRGYHSRDFSEALELFLAERAGSLEKLKSMNLTAASLQQTRRHPVFGEMRAGDLLAAWAAHDLLHLRQIIKRRFEYLQQVVVAPYAVGYAGAWTA